MNDLKNIIQGFKASAISAGLKKDNALDLALIFSEKEAAAAGVFTTNKVKAAPVILSRENINHGKVRAIVANAGNANACNGEQGLSDARRTAELVAEELGIRCDEVLVASTGVIGQPLDMGLITAAIPGLVANLSQEGMDRAAQAIMTTDSFSKIISFEGQAGLRSYRILGIAKGAGMIMPNMATMLCFILSDIRIDSERLKEAALSSVATTFNRITVDGDTSTNDMVLIMANGMAGNRALTETDYNVFKAGLREVMGGLATMIVRDGEGATRVIKVEVKGAQSASDALGAARIVANSTLVKTAFYGRDPNWGRILAALGRAGIVMEEKSVDIWIDDIQIVEMGIGKGRESEKMAAVRMNREEFVLSIDLHQGGYSDFITTCDLTHEYITINAGYRS